MRGALSRFVAIYSNRQTDVATELSPHIARFVLRNALKYLCVRALVMAHSTSAM